MSITQAPTTANEFDIMLEYMAKLIAKDVHANSSWPGLFDGSVTML